MGLGLLLLPALGGYWSLTRANCWKYGALRESGYHLVFRSACLGALLSAISYLALLPISYAEPKLGVSLADWARSPKPFTLFQVALGVGTLIGFVLPSALNRRQKDTELEALPVDPRAIGTPYSKQRRFRCTELEGARRAAAERGDLIELILQDSALRPMTAEISLHSGKTYIGFAIDSGIFQRDGSDPDIALLPVVSGYRGKQTQRLELTTFYRRIYEEIDKNEKPEDDRGSGLSVRDMRVILPLSEIRSARLFDLELHAKVSGR